MIEGLTWAMAMTGREAQQRARSGELLVDELGIPLLWNSCTQAGMAGHFPVSQQCHSFQTLAPVVISLGWS